MTSRQLVPALIALLIGLVVGVAIGRGGGLATGEAAEGSLAPATAATAPPATPQQTGISRTVLQTVDDPAADTHEVVMGVAEIPAGASSGMHLHPGIEVGYILEGTLVLHHEGREPETITAGRSFYNNGSHDAINQSDAPVKILAVWIVEKGRPLSEPVP